MPFPNIPLLFQDHLRQCKLMKFEMRMYYFALKLASIPQAILVPLTGYLLKRMHVQANPYNRAHPQRA